MIEDKSMIIIFLGPQGSGKGTQAELLSKKIGLPVIETGQLFRIAARSKSVEGKAIKKKLANGEFISDETTIQILKNQLEKINIEKGFILDGFPRNLTQAEFLEQFENRIVIYLDLPDREVIKRLSVRKICSSCGKIFTGFEDLNNCSVCKGRLKRREDDKPKAIRKRLDLFKNSTVPLLDYFQNKGIIIKVDGRLSIEKIFENILKQLKKVL